MWEPNLEKLSLEEFKKRYGEEMAELVEQAYDEDAIYYAHKENALALMWYYQIRNTVIYEEYNGIERYEDLSLSNDTKPDLRIEIKIE